jgi:undecaprenyl-diphosphatase
MINNINVELFYFFNHNLENPLFDAVMPCVTGAGGFICLLAFLVLLILFAKYKKKETLKRIAILALVSLLFADIIVLCLKHIVNEPRPFVSLSDVHLLISENDPCSFPSGHSASTLSVVTFFILNMKDLIRKHYVIADIALVIFAVAIPFSRMYVGVHYPLDVLSGALIGFSCALIVDRFKNRILAPSSI